MAWDTQAATGSWLVLVALRCPCVFLLRWSYKRQILYFVVPVDLSTLYTLSNAHL